MLGEHCGDLPPTVDPAQLDLPTGHEAREQTGGVDSAELWMWPARAARRCSGGPTRTEQPLSAIALLLLLPELVKPSPEPLALLLAVVPRDILRGDGRRGRRTLGVGHGHRLGRGEVSAAVATYLSVRLDHLRAERARQTIVM